MNAIVVISLLACTFVGNAHSRWSCAEVQPPENGRLTVLSYGVFARNTAIFAFSCNAGYTLKGQHCGLCVDGIVIHGIPKCIDSHRCPAVTIPARTEVTKLTWQQLMLKDYEEDTEKLYVMLLSIVDREERSSATRTRVLSEIKSILNVVGKISDMQSSELVGMNARTSYFSPLYSFKCVRGYSPDLPVFHKYCSNGEALPSLTPTCEAKPACPVLTSPANGSVHIFKPRTSRRTYVRGILIKSSGTAMFSCNRGFSLHPSGRKFATCENDGKWSADAPRCQLKCPTAQPPTNGNLRWKNGYLQLTCDKGFTLFGSSKIYCNSDGTWGTGDSFCLATYGRRNPCRRLNNSTEEIPESIETNRVQILSPLKKSSSNTTGYDKDTQVCQDLVPCSRPRKPSFGRYSVLGNIDPPYPFSRLHFTCSPGFVLQGKQTATCMPGGQWSAEIPICKRRPRCPAIYPIRHGGGKWVGNVAPFLHLSSVMFYCNQDYSMKGTPIVLCNNGVWMGKIPVCEKVCELPSPFPNGTATFPIYFGPLPSPFARFDCNNGFILQGQRFVRCTNQSWLTPLPTCQAKTPCPTIEAPTNGVITRRIIQDNPNTTVLDFGCNEGYELNGAPTISCAEEEGRWTDNAPRCEKIISCPVVSQPLNGRFQFLGQQSSDLLRPGTAITFFCDAGFVIDGELTIRCESSGVWSDSIPRCIENRDNGGFVIDEAPIGSRG